MTATAYTSIHADCTAINALTALAFAPRRRSRRKTPRSRAWGSRASFRASLQIGDLSKAERIGFIRARIGLGRRRWRRGARTFRIGGRARIGAPIVSHGCAWVLRRSARAARQCCVGIILGRSSRELFELLLHRVDLAHTRLARL